MKLQGEVQRFIQAFVDLLVEPFEQDIGGAVRAAGTAVTLAFALGAFVPTEEKVEAYGATLALMLLWAALTAVITNQDRRVAISRNLGVVSLWLAVVQLLTFLAAMILPSVLDRALRLTVVLVVLLILVPMHMFKNLAIRPAARMTVMLLVTTMTLTGLLIY